MATGASGIPSVMRAGRRVGGAGTGGVEDYECALVDALAVLGRGEYGWRDAESYPPILSRIIKVARLCHTVLNDQVNYPTGGGGMDVHSI
ncbi:predicted protein [Histoplasma mississippiense (nom. inval.)]|uniref:predicted protein n=1 Tax=Ajellomyces capsulatus (strain NAm1 / WU24) TaxID=2059318 RepID=UPI000157D340|nr:predicted protein [Histoplasma mississippiense (nom. inval.)]EDN04933.1 predicted protein [Histoplasma mississippiense (nom. inval.)]